jgi:hypothetical protein
MPAVRHPRISKLPSTLQVKGQPSRFCLVFFRLTLFALLFPAIAMAAPYQQVAGLIDLRTTFSDGAHTIDQIVALARARGFGAVFVTDHDRMALAYGLPPFRNLLKKKEEHNSINLRGADHYLMAIREVQKKYPDMIIIPGSETSPFYYWTGNPLHGDLTAHDHEKRLLTIGMENPEDYRDMPILHNRRNAALKNLTVEPFFYFGAILLSGILIVWRGPLRVMGMICLPISLIFLLDHDPLQTSPFNAYSGPQGVAPYQLVIDYVNNRNGMTFWNYPETRSGVRRLGPIQVSTKPYPGALQASKGYTGFSALYGDNITVTEPGNLWDMTLAEYCRGYRMWPPWGIATGDYHGEGKDGDRLGNYPTVFLVQEKKKEAILKAMQTGRMYACQTQHPLMPRLDEFFVSTPDGQKTAISGEEVTMSGHPKIHIALSASGAVASSPVTVRLIRSGTIIKTFAGNLPLNLEHEDPYFHRGEKIYYRMDMRGCGTIVSNPIFVIFDQ